MLEQKYNPLTVGYLKWALGNLPDEATVIVACDECNKGWATATQLTFVNNGELQIGTCGYNELKGWQPNV